MPVSLETDLEAAKVLLGEIAARPNLIIFVKGIDLKSTRIPQPSSAKFSQFAEKSRNQTDNK